jgi:hypothetical protein
MAAKCHGCGFENIKPLLFCSLSPSPFLPLSSAFPTPFVQFQALKDKVEQKMT